MDENKQIYIMSPTRGITGNRNMAVSAILYLWNKNKKTGYVFDSSSGFTLPSGAMRSPDAAWIKKEKWEALSIEDREKFAHICPDFIIEIKSKTDSLKEQQNKMQEWLENGCCLGWLIDFDNKIVYIYKPKHEVSVINTFATPISDEDVLQGFELNLNEIE